MVVLASLSGVLSLVREVARGSVARPLLLNALRAFLSLVLVYCVVAVCFPAVFVAGVDGWVARAYYMLEDNIHF